MEFPYQMQQFPEEIAWFAQALLRHGISTLFTIGVATGGVEWTIAKAYQEAGRVLDLTCVDIAHNESFDNVQALIRENYPLVKLTFLHKDVRDCHDLPKFDAVFIDGDHSEAGIKHDIEFAIAHATKIVAMHDIVGAAHTVAPAAAWVELKKRYQISASISVHPDLDKGIGIVYLESGRRAPVNVDKNG